MASFIKIKRSTGTLAPASIQYGELAYTTGVGTHGNSGGKLFIGDNVPNSIAIGGRYYTDLLSIAPGLVAGQTNPTTAANGFVAVLDQNRKVDQWNVDNLTLDGNTLSSTNIDGDINIDPNGSGEIVVPDDTFLTFGTSKDTKIKYDEITNDRLEVTGADWNFANGVAISLSDVTESTSTTTGAFTVTGGVGIGARLNVAGNVDFDGDLNIDGGDVTSNTTSLNLFNTTVSTANILGAGTNIVLGATTGVTTIRNAVVDLDGDLNIDGGDVTSNTANLNLFNSTVTRSNVLGAGTNIVLGATTGVTTIRNAVVDLDGDLNIDGGDLTTNQTTFNLLTTNATTVNAFDTATSVNIGNTSDTSTVTVRSTQNTLSTSTGALVVSGGVGIASDLRVGGDVYIDGEIDITSDTTIVADLTVEGNTNLGNSSTDQVTIVGNVYHTGVSTNVGGIFVDAVGISSNIIQTRPGTGDKLYIDPYPDGLSNEGTVIIKGDLQVDGTTTTVNSITVTSNNPIYVVGDNATTRTVMTTVASGSVITIDSVAGINTSDVVSGTNIPSNTIISSINSGTKEITLSNAIIGTIDAGTQLTITQGVDTNDDRGIAFKYISSGIGTEATVKTGFFGYTDSNSRWTYVPDAGIAGNVVTGTKGFLDIKGIYYQAGDFSTNGVNYFDSNGLMKSTVAPGAGISTSNYILTTDESGVPTWTDTIDGGMF
jgi:hypothetical protein